MVAHRCDRRKSAPRLVQSQTSRSDHPTCAGGVLIQDGESGDLPLYSEDDAAPIVRENPSPAPRVAWLRAGDSPEPAAMRLSRRLPKSIRQDVALWRVGTKTVRRCRGSELGAISAPAAAIPRQLGYLLQRSGRGEGSELWSHRACVNILEQPDGHLPLSARKTPCMAQLHLWGG